MKGKHNNKKKTNINKHINRRLNNSDELIDAHEHYKFLTRSSNRNSDEKGKMKRQTQHNFKTQNNIEKILNYLI